MVAYRIIGLAAILGMFVNVGTISFAFADDVEIVEIESKTWIFVADPKCVSDDSVERLTYEIAANRFQYGAYVGRLPYEVVCFPSAELPTLEITVELLRGVFPNDMFIFLFDLTPDRVLDASIEVPNENPHSDTSTFTITTYKEGPYPDLDYWYWKITLATLSGGMQGIDYENIDGMAFVEQGFAIADDRAEVANHEWVHLATCSVHDGGSDDRDVSTWTRVSIMPWCA